MGNCGPDQHSGLVLSLKIEGWCRVSGQKFALDFNPQATISVSADLRLEGLVLFNVTANRKSYVVNLELSTDRYLRVLSVTA